MVAGLQFGLPNVGKWRFSGQRPPRIFIDLGRFRNVDAPVAFVANDLGIAPVLVSLTGKPDLAPHSVRGGEMDGVGLILLRQNLLADKGP